MVSSTSVGVSLPTSFVRPTRHVEFPFFFSLRSAFVLSLPTCYLINSMVDIRHGHLPTLHHTTSRRQVLLNVDGLPSQKKSNRRSEARIRNIVVHRSTPFFDFLRFQHSSGLTQRTKHRPSTPPPTPHRNRHLKTITDQVILATFLEFKQPK